MTSLIAADTDRCFAWVLREENSYFSEYVDGGVDNDDDDDLIDELEEEEQLSTDRCPLPSISNSSASGRSCLHAIPIKARVILRLVMPVLM